MLKVEIGTIDMDGYCGRDKHPEASDGGQTAEVVSVATIDMSNDDVPEEATSPAGWRCPDDDDDDQYTEQLYTVTLNDGRTVELVEHEIKRIWICSLEDGTSTKA